MSRERKRNTKLVQSRRKILPEEDDGETGAAIIDDSASEANSDDDLQLSGSDNDEDEEDKEEEIPQQHDDGLNQKTKTHSKRNVPLPTSESYPSQGIDFTDVGDSNGSGGSGGSGKLTDTAIMLNGFKNVLSEGEGDLEDEAPIQFDELDDSISFEPRLSDGKTASSSSPTRATPSARGAARGRPDRETYWQKRNKDKEEYKKRLEDPTFTPYVGEFFMHDSRNRRQFDSLNQLGGARGRGRGRGFRGNVQRASLTRDEASQEPFWDHDGFEELEPHQSQAEYSKACHIVF
jgi:hypothetical protein